MTRPVFIVDGARTPFLKARGRPNPFTPVDLAVACGRPLLLRQPFGPEAIDEVILGCVSPEADEMNPARIAALRLGLGADKPAWTVQRNCGSGMQSIDAGFRAIEEGRAEIVLAGGSEALSHAPLVVKRRMVEWLADFRQARGPLARLRQLAALRPAMLAPEIGLERGLTDPVVDLSMGQTAEVLAHAFRITREAADAYAAESHRRLAAAQAEGRLPEVEPIFDREGRAWERDDGVRPDTTPETLATLRPAFERPWGSVTAGNSSQITDGAAWVILASEEALADHGLRPLARILDSHWAALDPAIMGLGPVMSSVPLLTRWRLQLSDIDYWEINEAFAAQVLACLAAMADDAFARANLGLDRAPGRIAHERLNVDGGAISLGHPVGTSGTRIVLHLAHVLRERRAARGIATECIGGGQGGAMLLEAA
jgi:acetyl-CoA C-acetyltransferase